ncbi:MAG: hypothetical protein CL917_15070 [Deltaproteobacteria bacterium]|nr:hypothetical protein [Deltaproteobacteria bacterium]
MNLQDGLQISDVIGIVRRRGRVVAWTSGIIILFFYWIVMALPNQYSSYATILVEPQAIDEALVTAGVRERDLQERLGIMSARILSRARISKLIDEFDLYPEESATMQRQEVIDLMRSALSVEPVLSELESDNRNADVVDFNRFKIVYRNSDSKTAAVVAQSLANDFLDANITARIAISQQSLSFMEDSMNSLREQAESAESEIKNVKRENAGHLPEDLPTNQRILEQLIAQMREAQRALALARSDESFWKSQVIVAESMVGGNDRTSPAYRRKTLESELSAMEARGYTEKHPDVAHARQELVLLQEKQDLRRAESDNSDDSSKDNSNDSYAEQNAKSELRRAGLAAIAAQEDIDRLAAQQESVQEEIAATPLVAEQLNALEREYRSMITSFESFAVKRQQAAVQANLERKQLGEQFRILESAFAAARPGSPNRVLMLVIGVLFGVGVGAATGLLLEASDSSIHDARRLQAFTNMPVLVSIPSITLDPDRRARRRRLVLELALASLITLFFLAGGAVTYFYVNGGSASLLDEGTSPAPDDQNEAQNYYSPGDRFAQRWMA